MSSHSFTSGLAECTAGGRPLRVVVGWDSKSTEAVEFAAWLGRSLPVSVQVVSAVETSWKKPLSGKKYKKWFKDRASEFEQQARKVLKAHVPRAQWAKQSAHLAPSAHLTDSLCESAQEFSADLILLGSSAKTQKGRFRPTSTADALMHASPVPLGLAPRDVHLSRKGITRVTYAVVDRDAGGEPGAPEGEVFSGLRYAATLACVLSVPLRIIAFSPSAENSTVSEHAAEWNEATLGLLDRARDEAFRVAAAIDARCADSLDVHSNIAVGKGWKRAIDSVKWKKGDLMCLGSRPSEQYRRVFVGSTEGKFIRFAPVPVLIYPRGAA